ADSLRDIFRLRGSEHKDDMARRLFEGLQQCVEGCVGNLMGFVQNVNLETIACRTITGRLAQLANLVNTAVCGSIDFDYIDRVSGANLDAGVTNSTGFGHGPVCRTAIQGHCQNAGYRGLPNAAMSA